MSVFSYAKFSDTYAILNYDYKRKEEINEALGALESMYRYGNIEESTYKHIKKLLEDRKRDLK